MRRARVDLPVFAFVDGHRHACRAVDLSSTGMVIQRGRALRDREPSLVGAFAGAALIVAARDWLSGPWPGHAPMLVGLLLVITVYTLPGGLAGAGARLRQAIDRRLPS